MIPRLTTLWRAVASHRQAPRNHRPSFEALAVWTLMVFSGQRAVAATFDFIHVQANAGGSSGGHVAACIADHCYHFQQASEGELLLVREQRARFEHAYRALGNRALVVRRVAVSEEALARIDDRFLTYHRVQNQQLALRAAYADDRALLEFLHARVSAVEEAQAGPPVPGAAYFFADSSARGTEAGFFDRRTVALADRIRAVHGSDILEQREAELRDEIDQLSSATAVLIRPQDVALSPATTLFAERYRDLLTGLLAVSVLRDGRGLRPGSFIAPTDADFALGTLERVALDRHAGELESELVRLVRSRRPDWGFPLLAGLARLLALDASVTSGFLVLLDTFPTNARTLGFDRWVGYENAFDLLLQERRADFRRARAAFFHREPRSELHWSRLEMAGNLVHELAHAQRERADARVHSDHLVPDRAVWRSDWPTPALHGRALAIALDGARAREEAYRAAFHDRYAYDLIARNCATELLREIEAALGDSDTERGARRVDPDGLLNFIPFVAAREVGAGYRVVATYVLPSYRQLALVRASEGADAVGAYLREANVLTSRVYRWHSADPIFLLFSDDAVLTRPLAGTVNLVAGLAAVTLGIAWLPHDSGTLLRDAFNGVLYSLPELAFVSIRKGSFPIAPQSWLSPAAGSIGSRSDRATTNRLNQ